MDTVLYYLPLLAYLAAAIIGGYGVLLLGRLLNTKLLQERKLRWLVILAGVAGIALIAVRFVVSDEGDWCTAFGSLLLILAVVTLINFKGKRKVKKASAL